MIADLLEVTRAQEGKLSVDLQCTPVSEAIAYAVKTLHETAKAKGVTLSSESPPSLPLAYADPTRIRQILIILLDNAVKFTGPGGTVDDSSPVAGAGSLLLASGSCGFGMRDQPGHDRAYF